MRIGKRGGFFGQLVKVGPENSHVPSFSSVWILRPLQGIGPLLVFAERLLQLFQFSVGVTPSRILIRLTLFVLGTFLVSLFLSIIWALDDLGVKVYNRQTEEVRMVGSGVGTILPIIAGSVGIATLFQHTDLVGALSDLLGITMILYPPYVLLIVIHHEFIKRKRVAFVGNLPLKRLETREL